MADGEAYKEKTSEESRTERERLYGALDDIERRERKEYRTYNNMLDRDLSKRYDQNVQSLELLADEKSVDAHINGQLKHDEEELTRYIGVQGIFTQLENEKSQIAIDLSKNGEDSDQIYEKMRSGSKVAKEISKKIAELQNKITREQKLFLTKIQARKDIVIKTDAEKAAQAQTYTNTDDPVFENTIETGEPLSTDDPFSTDFGADDSWETQAQADFDVATNNLRRDNEKRETEKSDSLARFEEGSFGPDDLRAAPTSVFDPVPEDDFSSATVTSDGGLSLTPMDSRAARDQEKYETMMRLEGIDTSNDPLEFTLDDADRRPVSNWRNAQNASRIVTQADIEAKNKIEAANRADALKESARVRPKTSNTFLPEDTELLTDDQKSLLSPNDPSKAWNEGLNGVRDRELQNAKSTEELVGLLAGKYGNSTFGLGGRKKTGRELAAILATGQNQENIDYGIQIADRELAQKAQELQEGEQVEEEEMIEDEREALDQDTYKNQSSSDFEKNAFVKDFAQTIDSDRASAIEDVLKNITKTLSENNINPKEFFKNIPGRSELEKLQKIISESKTVSYAFPIITLGAATCVDLIEFINLIPGAGLVTLILISILKYTIFVPFIFVSTFGDAGFITKQLIRRVLTKSITKRGYFLILSPLAEFIPFLGSFWPGTTLFVLWLVNAKTSAGKMTVELAKKIESGGIL